MNKKAVILLSGGLDSTTCLAIAREQGFDIFALTINYGQRHTLEIESAKSVVKNFDVIKPVSYTHLTLPTICSV